MAEYVDGFLLSLPTANLPAYKKIAKLAGKVWKEHGALQYRECVVDQLEVPGMPTSFAKLLRLKPEETVIMAWITYPSKAERNAINKKVMADPRMLTDEKAMPFNVKKMYYAGFKTLVEG